MPSASRASFSCHACGGPVPVLDAPALNYLVGSDCTPIRGAVRVGTCENCGLLQKEISPSWQKLCDEIYGNYRIYHQAGGYEQKARSVDGGGSEVINNLDISHAAYMIDLLRNEAPITYEITEKILATASQEPVGEGE